MSSAARPKAGSPRLSRMSRVSPTRNFSVISRILRGRVVEHGHLADDVSALVIIVRESEGGASFSLWRITRAGNMIFGLGAASYHGYHHAQRSDVQRASNEVIIAAWHANHRNELQAAT